MRFSSTLRWTAALALVDAALWAQIAWAWTEGARWASVVLAWPALSLLIVVGLYLGASWGRDTGPWMHRRRTPWMQPLLWPYILCAWSLTGLMRALRGPESAPTEVVRGLWLGMLPAKREARALEAASVHAIVDLCAELASIRRVYEPPFERLEVPTMDRCPPTLAQLERAVTWIAERRARGQSVYVHCAFGRGRSAMVTAAALVRLGHARSTDEAIDLLRRARPSVRVQGDQRRALDAWVRAQARSEEPASGSAASLDAPPRALTE
jgi:hypothetical protein